MTQKTANRAALVCAATRGESRHENSAISLGAEVLDQAGEEAAARGCRTRRTIQ
jgi:hypothetical protein